MGRSVGIAIGFDVDGTVQFPAAQDFYLVHSVQTLGPTQPAIMLTEPAHLRTPHQDCPTQSPINSPEKESHLHIANEQPGISTKAVDDGSGLQYWPSLQTNIASKGQPELTLKVAAEIFSEIENHQQMTMHIPESPKYTLNTSHEYQRKRVKVLLLCVKDNLAPSV